MYRPVYFLIFPALVGGVFLTAEVRAESELPLWDGAVNRLLAVGLYGIDEITPSLAVRLESSRDLYKGLPADKGRLHGQAITFSYEGSSGLLGFSAGYIYTSGIAEGTLGAVYLGLDDPLGLNMYDRSDCWYLALDISTSYQPHDDITLGLSGKTMLMDDPYSLSNGQVFSLLLNMPVSYKKYITITPELQWSRTLPGQGTLVDGSGPPADEVSKDILYGGVSVTFSY